MEPTHSLFRRVLSKDSLSKALHSLPTHAWRIFLALLCVCAVSTLLIVNKVNNSFLVTVPAAGGHITEGVIGTPRFVNPVLALSDSEKDLTTLVYSGLMQKNPDGEIVPDLAESYTLSADGLTYTLTLRQGLTFHDGTPLTATDVVYTINQIKNPSLKSPKKVNWDGVTVENTDDVTIVYTLKQPFASFLENTTVGILPAHIWSNVADEEFNFSDLNMQAVGSGPYMVRKISKKSSGIPSSYELSAFKNYAGGKPNVSKLYINFYPNENDLLSAYNGGDIDQMAAISPNEAAALVDNGAKIMTAPLSRIFGLFFNQSQAPIFTDKTIVKALDMAIDKQKIVDTVLHGYGTPIDSPIPPKMYGEENNPANINVGSGDKAGASALLLKAGWKPGEDGVLVKKTSTIVTPATTGKNKKAAVTKDSTTRLEFSIATGDTPELRDAANLIAEDLKAIGVSVEVKVFETGNLNQNVIRPRKYDALFFGQIISHESDFFAFWHSSQRNDPGLNVAGYASAKVDQLLESALTASDREERKSKYLQVEQEIQKDMPAVFVYAPDFIYVVKNNLGGFAMDRITASSERFLDINNWYVDTDTVWKIFHHESE